MVVVVMVHLLIGLTVHFQLGMVTMGHMDLVQVNLVVVMVNLAVIMVVIEAVVVSRHSVTLVGLVHSVVEGLAVDMVVG